MQVDQRPGGSALGTPPLAGPDLWPTPRRSRGNRLVSALWAAALAVAGLAVVDVLTGPRYPGAWDPAVAPLAGFVEDARGLRFEHPVHVDFLTADDYTEKITDAPLSGGEAEDLDTWAVQLRSLGLASGDLDLAAIWDTLGSEGTLAFYDESTERITVRGTRLSPAMEVTLVHELTHALQDQHFDLGRNFATAGADGAFRALVEGDAVRIEDRYLDGMSPAEEDAYWEETAGQIDEADGDLSGIPPVFPVLFGAPYELGRWFVDIVEASGGQAALDRAFRTPPAGELALLDPGTWLDGDRGGEVSTPDLRRGEEEIERGDLGALTLYTMLAARIDPAEALAAIASWDGDAYVAYEDGARSCLRVSVASDGADGAGRLYEALGRWGAALGPGGPHVVLDGSLVTVTACDPGPHAERGPDAERVDATLALPVVRSMIVAGALRNGADEEAARCVGTGVVDVFPPEALAGPPGGDEAQAAFDEAMAEIMLGCLGQGETGAASVSA